MKCHRFIILSFPHSSDLTKNKKNHTERLYFSKGGDRNVYLPICWIYSSRRNDISAKNRHAKNAPRLCKKPALVVQLNRIQPRLVELAQRWGSACTTTTATTTANWPQYKDVRIRTRPAAHLEDTSPTSNLGRAALCRVTLPRVIALRSELIQRPTKYLLVEGEKKKSGEEKNKPRTLCAEPLNGEAAGNS